MSLEVTQGKKKGQNKFKFMILLKIIGKISMLKFIEEFKQGSFSLLSRMKF